MFCGIIAMSACATLSADPRFYADLGFGYSALESMPEADGFSDFFGVIPVGDATSTANNYGGRLAAGLMWDTDATLAYGVEIAAAYYGVDKYSNDASSVEMNYYGIELLGVAQLNIDKVMLIGKAGVTDEQLHPTKSNINNSGLTDSQEILPEVGAGIAYAITPSFQVGVTYYHTFGNTVTFNSSSDVQNLPSVDMTLLEVKYLS